MPRERRTWQLIDPSWKDRNWASRTATVAVLILTFLCKGMRGQQTEGYTLKAPASVSVQRGLCVHIPCTFTYDSQLRTSSQKLNAYWLQDKASWNYYGNTPRYLVATNDKYKKVHYSFSSRFQLTGNPEHGDCSFSINDVKSDDQELYYLRIDDGQSLKFSYRNSYTRPRVVVNELTEKPEIWKSSEIIVGTPVTITCQAPGTCSGTPPQISWSPYYIGDTYIGNGESWKQPHSNGSMTYGSNISFTPSGDNKGQVLTCRVTYPAAEWRTVENTIRLDTAYAPSSVQISINITSDGHPGSSQQRSKDGQVEVMEGKSVSLLCQSNSIPDPLLIWTKVNKTLNDSKQAKEHHLLLPKIRPEDSGLYQCQAKNLLGSVEETLRVIVKYPPRTVQLIVSQTQEWDPMRPQDPPRAVDHGSQLTAREGNALRLICTTDGNPPVEVSWVKEERTMKQWSSSPNNWLELTNLTVEDKGEYTCMARNTLATVQSTFQLDIAFAPRLFRKTNSTCWHEDNDILCTCALQSYPSPQIWWQVEGKTLIGNISRGSLNVTSWLQGRKATSHLRLMDSLDKDHSIICLGNNSVGVYTMQFLLRKTGSRAGVIISGFLGALLAATLCLIGFFLIRFYKKRKASTKAGVPEARSNVNEMQPSTKNPSLIYGNVFPANPRTPKVGQPKPAREMNTAPSQTPRAPRPNAEEPGELNYATLEFNLKNRRTPTPSEDSVEYSAVRVK